MKSHPLIMNAIHWTVSFCVLLAVSLGIVFDTPIFAVEGSDATAPPQVRIALLAGNPSHGYGSHEHLAGCRILADAIERSTDGRVECVVYSGGWPEDDSALDSVQAIVMYADGGGGHPALRHLDRLGELLDRGVGFACLHYAVEVPTDRGGPEFLGWLGGYFETHWSVNPHWEAHFTTLPDHPVTQGVKPFKAMDEWYFHMRFQPEMKGVTPILSAIAPPETMRRPDGPHSGNPHVRQAVANGEPQHTAWVFDRPDGGRSFGFTGGHFHWNWGREEILKLVCNAIVWTAKADIPATGLPVLRPGVEKLEQGQDYAPPGDYQRERIQREFRIISRPGDRPMRNAPSDTPARLLGKTQVITPQTPDHAERLVVDVSGVEKLFLVVNDAGNGFSCDWADWIQPMLEGPGVPALDMTTLEWKTGQTQWGQIRVGKNAGGGPLSVNGKPFQRGIGTHANSVLSFELPSGYERLTVLCGLDNGGTDQAGGAQSSVQFMVYADALPAVALTNDGPARDPANAISGLEIHPEVSATLAAWEPTLRSLTNIDVDHRGRVWACEVMNYRGHNGRREAGDRILILEDEDGDGVMDVGKVFYQGRDIDSAMGICVLGNQVIVSASPNIWVLTDDDGDDYADRKELLFSQTGVPQHDHSAHSFVFGPDGKLYWNFGNTGHAVHDRNGEPVTDRSGTVVRDHGKPYREGMVFRCNLDGSEFEVLGHNFRNNYEVAVDSFGNLWQSDNDDDGNRGVRINYVMEYGNYGYRDELTGAGWQTPRTNWESEIPQRHWHLNDPGVVPTMLLTGAGSPAGITVYEGDLLPEAFRGQPLHCDPGPNVVRAYPTTAHGAGYQAEIVNLMQGITDKWFRPADVCVAPDGSVFVSDWYDPGVGGHQMGDLDRGRLYRIAPPNTPYKTPKLDVTTPETAVQALRSPNASTRYLAWRAIQNFGAQAVSALKTLSQDEQAHLRARAYWAWGKIPGQATAAVAAAAADSDPENRVLAIRLADQTAVPHDSYFSKLLIDESAAVRRQLAISLRFHMDDDMPNRWAALAQQYDGEDRWYLEALGIGAERRWDECFTAYMEAVHERRTTPHIDIVWRARTALALSPLQTALTAPDLPAEDAMRLLRATEYHAVEPRQAALTQVAQQLVDRPNRSIAHDRILTHLALHTDPTPAWVVEPKLQGLWTELLTSADRTTQLQLAQKTQIPGRETALVRLAMTPDTVGVNAGQTLLAQFANGDWRQLLTTPEEPAPDAVKLIETFSLLRPELAVQVLTEIMNDSSMNGSIRVAAARGLTKHEAGAQVLFQLAKENQLPLEARLIVGSQLRSHRKPEISSVAAELFPAPKGKAAVPLPALDQLVQRRGDAAAGATIYRTIGTCANCHQVGSNGKNVGPDLSQIGDKLAKEALYVSILDPSAAISHSYESHAALTLDGQLIVGLLVSQTDSEVILKDAEGIQRTLRREDLDEFKRLETSLMPDNIVESLSTDELVDLVEYLTTLKK